MKLIVRIMDACGVPGGIGVVLCDEDGRALPNQMLARLETTAGDAPKLIVEFVVDGDWIRLIKSAGVDGASRIEDRCAVAVVVESLSRGLNGRTQHRHDRC